LMRLCHQGRHREECGCEDPMTESRERVGPSLIHSDHEAIDDRAGMRRRTR
jgi:hypothetical protein